MTNEEKIRNAEVMYGTGSRQHLAAIERFGRVVTARPRKTKTARTRATIIRVDSL